MNFIRNKYYYIKFVSGDFNFYTMDSHSYSCARDEPFLTRIMIASRDQEYYLYPFDLVVIPQWLVVIPQQGNFKAPQSIIGYYKVALLIRSQ